MMLGSPPPLLLTSSGDSKVCSPRVKVNPWKRVKKLFVMSLLMSAKGSDSPETTHVSSHSSKVSKLLAFPPQPPYSNSSQCPVSTLKKNRSLMALQGPDSSFRAHSSLKMKSSDSGPSAEVG